MEAFLQELSTKNRVDVNIATGCAAVGCHSQGSGEFGNKSADFVPELGSLIAGDQCKLGFTQRGLRMDTASYTPPRHFFTIPATEFSSCVGRVAAT